MAALSKEVLSNANGRTLIEQFVQGIEWVRSNGPVDAKEALSEARYAAAICRQIAIRSETNIQGM